MRLVLDTCILVASLRSAKGASRAVLKLAFERRFELLISVPIVLEYEAVLTRSVHLADSGLNVDEVAELVDAICAIGRPVGLKIQDRSQTADPDDEMVLETAINGQADGLVTFNRSHFAEPCERLGIPLLAPQDVLRRIEPR